MNSYLFKKVTLLASNAKKIYLCGINIFTMELKEYDNDSPVTMASEPAVACQSISSSQTWTLHKDSMTVDEYFNKVRKALDKRYENL